MTHLRHLTALMVEYGSVRDVGLIDNFLEARVDSAMVKGVV